MSTYTIDRAEGAALVLELSKLQHPLGLAGVIAANFENLGDACSRGRSFPRALELPELESLDSAVGFAALNVLTTMGKEGVAAGVEAAQTWWKQYARGNNAGLSFRPGLDFVQRNRGDLERFFNQWDFRMEPTAVAA